VHLNEDLFAEFVEALRPVSAGGVFQPPFSGDTSALDLVILSLLLPISVPIEK
jgi:hypothetical protein